MQKIIFRKSKKIENEDISETKEIENNDELSAQKNAENTIEKAAKKAKKKIPIKKVYTLDELITSYKEL